MTAKGHVVLASTLAVVPIEYLINNYSATEAIFAYIAILLGSLIPDIDEPNSYIGNRSLFLADFLKLLGLKHRTFTHWLIVPISIATLGFITNDFVVSMISYSLAYGILAHDIGDLITKGGIRGFFFPLFKDKKIVILPSFLRFKTFSISEYLVIGLLMILNIYAYTEVALNEF